MYEKITNAPSIFIIEFPQSIGTNKPAKIVVAKITIGANLNTHEVVKLITWSFLNNLIKSYNG